MSEELIVSQRPPEGPDCVHVLNLGYVLLVDRLGDDQTIVKSARLSYSGTRQFKRSDDRNLMRYLLRKHHTSPFEQVVFTFQCKMPIFVARQWVRHRTARLNEMSGRYSVLPEEYYDYSEQGLAAQSTANRQGSEGKAFGSEEEAAWLEDIEVHNQRGFEMYKQLIDKGVSNELARCHLPLSTYTEWVWQMDLHNLFHFLTLRLDAHAQKEIRVYGEAIYKLIQPIVPMACEAFEDYILNAMTLSRMEIEAIKRILFPVRQGYQPSDELLRECGLGVREMGEFRAKLARLIDAGDA